MLCLKRLECSAECGLFLWCLSIGPLEIILICRFAAQETFLIIINVEKSCAASYFYEKCDTLLFRVILKTYTFIQQCCIKLISVTVKSFILLITN